MVTPHEDYDQRRLLRLFRRLIRTSYKLRYWATKLPLSYISMSLIDLDRSCPSRLRRWSTLCPHMGMVHKAAREAEVGRGVEEGEHREQGDEEEVEEVQWSLFRTGLSRVKVNIIDEVCI